MTKKFWTIPVITVYIYAVTVLANSGFVSYFDIPRYFIGSSIKENILFAHMLFQMVWQLAGAIGILWLLIIPALLVAAFYTEKFIRILITLCLLWFGFFGSSMFGSWIAEKQVTFLSPSDQCEQFVGGKYAVVAANEDVFAIIKIDENKKMEKGFKPYLVSDLSCGMDYKDLGPIIK